MMINRCLQLNHCGSNWNLTIAKTVFTSCLVLIAVDTVAVAQKTDKTLTQDVFVVDEDGQPIAGVSLLPISVRYWQPPPLQGSHAFLGDLVDATMTDELGKASLVIPRNSRGKMRSLSLEIDHDSFVEKSEKFNFKDSPVAIVLERGWLISTSGIDAETKEPVTGSLYALTNQGPRIDWDHRWAGQLHSPLVGRAVTSFRLVEIIDQKPTRFSKLIEVEHGEKQRLHYHDLEMTSAITVSGKLIDEDQQPVEHGLVTAYVVDVDVGKFGNAPSDGERFWRWRTIVHSKEDGSFVLEGVPANSVLQIVASGKTCSNKPLSVEEMRKHFPQALDGDHSVLPQLVHVGKEDRDVTVALQPLGSATIKVVDSAMQPIADAKVGYSSTQTFLYSGKPERFVYRASSARRLLWLRSPLLKFSDSRVRSYVKFSRFILNSDQKDSNLRTDPKGVVVTSDLPAGKANIHVACPEGYTGPNGEQSVSLRETIKSDETTEVTVQLKRIESNESTELPNGKND